MRSRLLPPFASFVRLATAVSTGSALAGIMHAQQIRSPAAVIATSLGTYNDPDVSTANMINQSGLDVLFTSGVTSFDDYFASAPPKFAQANYKNNWQSLYVDPLPLTGTVDFDLGSTLNVSKVALWSISLENLEIQLSGSPAGPYQTVGSFSPFSRVNFPASYTVDLIDLGGTHTGRYLRIKISSAYKQVSFLNGTYAIIGEVAVRANEAGTPPPPPPAGSAKISNLSVRSAAGTAAETLIVGFVAEGTDPKPVLIRGIGPTLTGLGVTGALADPKLKLFPTSATLPTAENDNWGGSPTLGTLFDDLGAFALAPTSADAAISTTLATGPYTTHVTSDAGSGIALAEIYDAGGSSRLVNISARTLVGSGNDILIAGFVISGNAPLQLLVRGIGPGLTQFNIAGTLANPQLRIFPEGSSIPIAENDDWVRTTTLENVLQTVGAFDIGFGSQDAVLLVTLDPGAYTAQVSGTTGIGLVEIYEVPSTP